MGDGGMATRSRPLGGPCTLVRRSPVAWFRRKQKSRSSWWKLQPRDLVFGPALPGQVARDVRPHPPHGGAACAYTCSRRLGCESRSAYGRRCPREPSTVICPCWREAPALGPSTGSASADDRHPRDVPRVRGREG